MFTRKNANPLTKHISLRLPNNYIENDAFYSGACLDIFVKHLFSDSFFLLTFTVCGVERLLNKFHKLIMKRSLVYILIICLSIPNNRLESLSVRGLKNTHNVTAALKWT